MYISPETEKLAKEIAAKDFPSPSSANRAIAFYSAWDGPKTPLEKDITEKFLEGEGYPGDIVFDFAAINSFVKDGSSCFWGFIKRSGSYLFKYSNWVKDVAVEVYRVTEAGLIPA